MSNHGRFSSCAAAAMATLVALFAAGCGATDRQSATTSASLKLKQDLAGARLASPPKAPPSKRPTIPAGRVLRTFSGTGNQRLGSLSERKPIVVEWHAAGRPIQLFTAAGFILLDSQARTGRIRLLGGAYRDLRVATPDHWMLRLRVAT